MPTSRSSSKGVTSRRKRLLRSLIWAAVLAALSVVAVSAPEPQARILTSVLNRVADNLGAIVR